MNRALRESLKKGITMKLYDISRLVFEAEVYPGDPSPVKTELLKIADGDKCNLSEFKMCCHNGTHVDAPYHFIDHGKTIGEMGLDRFIGRCCVIDLRKHSFKKVMEHMSETDRQMLLLKGKLELSVEDASRIAEQNIVLLGIENNTVGDAETGPVIHKILLEKEIVILEGIVLDQIEEEEYFLAAQPIHLGHVDGAPCRAVLIG